MQEVKHSVAVIPKRNKTIWHLFFLIFSFSSDLDVETVSSSHLIVWLIDFLKFFIYTAELGAVHCSLMVLV